MRISDEENVTLSIKPLEGGWPSRWSITVYPTERRSEGVIQFAWTFKGACKKAIRIIERALV